jgi:sugar phosphate isomerase/epimerase
MAIRLGGPIFNKSDDPVELARAHRKLGYRAGYCPDVSLEDKDRIKAIEEAFKAEDVVIAEVGAWGLNMMEPDAEQRKKNLDAVCVKMALADEVGALCCINVAGSFSTGERSTPHPENLSQAAYDLTVENIRYILDSVKPKRSKFVLEMMPWVIPDTPDSFLKLVLAIDRPEFGVHLDPVNMINSPKSYYENAELLEESFEKLGKWLVSCHAKDSILTTQLTTHLNEARPGTGGLDYRTFLRGLEALPQDAPLLMEHLKGSEEYDKAREYIFSVGEEIGISF